MKQKIKTIIEYGILLLIGLSILIQLSKQQSLEEKTGAVILNMKKINDQYEIENVGQTRIKLTIEKNETITNRTTLLPKKKMIINDEQFNAIGESDE